VDKRHGIRTIMRERKQELSFKDLIMERLRSLERRGFIVSFLGSDGQVRWRLTEKEFAQHGSEIDDDHLLS
jgi:hypothetical protein